MPKLSVEASEVANVWLGCENHRIQIHLMHDFLSA